MTDGRADESKGEDEHFTMISSHQVDRIDKGSGSGVWWWTVLFIVEAICVLGAISLVCEQQIMSLFTTVLGLVKSLPSALSYL